MTLIEKAHDLANAITTSEEYQVLRQAEQDMLNDDDAQALIDKYNDLQQRLATEDESDALNAEIESLQQLMEDTPTLAAYLQAQDKVTAVLEEINFILGRAINGEDNEEEACDSGSCSSGCCGCK